MAAVIEAGRKVGDGRGVDRLKETSRAAASEGEESSLLYRLREASRAMNTKLAITMSLTVREVIVFENGPVVLTGETADAESVEYPKIIFEGAGAFTVRGNGSLTLRRLCLRTKAKAALGHERSRRTLKCCNRRTVSVAGAKASLFLEYCRIICEGRSSDESPYPKTGYAAAVLATRRSTLAMTNCEVMSPGFQARGVVVKSGGRATLTETKVTECNSSAVWVCGRASRAALKSCVVTKCGGYGAIYCTFGGSVSVRNSSVTFGKYGIMCLHDGSKMECTDSEFAFCLWSGVASRWSGSGTVTRCRVHSNGANGFQIRKSCSGPGGVVVTNCIDEKNHIDPMYAFKHRDLQDTQLSRKGLPSRGVSATQASAMELLTATK